MRITVKFSGVLAGVTGIRMKTYTRISSLEDLKMRLFDDFPEIQHYNFRMYRNNELTDGNIELNEEDRIVMDL